MRTKLNLQNEGHLVESRQNNNGILYKEILMDNDPLKIYYDLENECNNNLEFFQRDNTEKGKHLYNLLGEWIENVKKSRDSVAKVSSFVSEYDFDETTPGNGYRSFVRVTDACAAHGLRICKNLTNSRERILFRKNYYLKEIESCNELQASLKSCLNYLFILKECSEEGNLFAKENVETLFEKGETINQHSFYGRCLGFQYRKSIQGVLRFISITMAGFSESYYSNGGRIAKTTSSVWTGGKYFLNPELRAKRIVNISQNASIDFCKSFWFLAESELMHAIPTIVGCAVKVNTLINIPPEPLILESQTENGKLIDIPIPTVHLGPKAVMARLLSTNRYKNMIGLENKKNLSEMSNNLLFHCHGGGFVAQSSKSHELYLRDWASHIRAPILSIDYSLAPEAPFPRALNEVFYAYCWALKNAEKLGWSGKSIVVAGDSAGANLVLGVTLKCVQLGVRKPDGIFVAYCPTLINFIPSPARLLCLMDPILPFGFMMRCLKAYAFPNDVISEKKNEINDLNENHSSKVKNVKNTLNLPFNDDAIHLHTNSPSMNSHIEDTIKSDLETEEAITSPFSDGASDTFASASSNGEKYSRTVENTRLSECDISSCTSLEDDSQPITHMPIDSVTSCSKSNGECKDGLFQTCSDQNSIKTSQSNNKINIPCKKGSQINLEDNLENTTNKEIIPSDSIQNKFNSAVSSFSSTINKFIGSNQIQVPINDRHNFKKIDALICRSPTEEFLFDVPKNPFMSPFYTSDEELAQYPKTVILTVDMDPCLDDCVMFAKKLKKLNVDTSLDILQGLPHGFLNFTMMSSEAMEGSKACSSHIKNLFESNNGEENL